MIVTLTFVTDNISIASLEGRREGMRLLLVGLFSWKDIKTGV